MLETTIKQLKKESKEEGIEKGKEKGVYKVALNMIGKGMDDSTIKEVTGLSSEKIKELKKKSDYVMLLKESDNGSR